MTAHVDPRSWISQNFSARLARAAQANCIEHEIAPPLLARLGVSLEPLEEQPEVEHGVG